MNNIEIKVLNPGSVAEAEKLMVCAARLTQKGHTIKNVDDFLKLYETEYTSKIVKNMANLPHPTIQRFERINVVIVGASRRFLAQITRHQDDVKFMSASCQYSDYSGNADFVVPYELIDKPNWRDSYIAKCQCDLHFYEDLVASGVDHDDASYALPQGLRNVLIISASPFEWKHMISQRICRRNTRETRYVMLKIWKELYALSPELFSNSGPFCMLGKCEEGKMSCGNIMSGTPDELLKADFGLLED